MHPLKVVSLYDGISCGRVALEKAGFAVSHFAAFEIDKYPRSISRYQYPDIIHHGDVLLADFNQFKGYDLVMGGSPCTFWSIAKTGREVDKTGMGWKLFMRFVDAVRQVQPRYFLYENVASMPKNIKAYISEELGCEPILINSALVSAQQRKRLYWTNIPNVIHPMDCGILLKDILEEEQLTLKDKSQTLCAQFYKENVKSLVIRKKHGLIVAEPLGAALRTRGEGDNRGKRLEVRGDGKLNALTTVQTDSVVCTPVRVGHFATGGQGNRIYSVHGKTVSLMAHGGGRGAKTGLYKIDLPDGDYTIRKLTPIEAERCQTLPDDYTALGTDDSDKEVKISNTQRYKAIGNGWTVDVIAHILAGMEVSADALCACAA